MSRVRRARRLDRPAPRSSARSTSMNRRGTLYRPSSGHRITVGVRDPAPARRWSRAGLNLFGGLPRGFGEHTRRPPLPPRQGHAESVSRVRRHSRGAWGASAYVRRCGRSAVLVPERSPTSLASADGTSDDGRHRPSCKRRITCVATKSVALQQSVERGAIDAREPRRSRYVARRPRDEPSDVLLLERSPARDPSPRDTHCRAATSASTSWIVHAAAARPFLVHGQVVDSDFRIRLRQHDEMLDDVLQLADVAAPRARHQELHAPNR